MVKKLEKILRGFGRGIITAGLAASFILGCSDEEQISNPIEPVQPAPKKNNAPVFTSSPITSVNENGYYRWFRSR